jgi:hypothetical protein
MSGDEGYRAVLADCERALGRPEVALRLVREALSEGADEEETTELQLVEAGARADVGELPAALLVLEDALGGRPRLEALDLTDEAVLRLAAAYADLLEATGHADAGRWQEAVEAAQPDEDIEFGEEDLPEEDDAVVLPERAGVDAAAVEDVEGEDVQEEDLEEDDAVDEADLLDLPGTSDADIEAEVAELLGETPEPPVDDAGPSEAAPH